MSSRIELQSELESLLGSENVYYQTPASVAMKYPAIRYTRSHINVTYANNRAYSLKNRYELTVIAKLPDNPVIEKLLALPYCHHDRHYVADNLHHDVLTLYY